LVSLLLQYRAFALGTPESGLPRPILWIIAHRQVTPYDLCPEVIDFVCSFPLLKDLALISIIPESDTDGWNPPLSSPKFTGSLNLRPFGRARPVIRRLLDLPGGLYFSEVTVVFTDEDVESVTDLVSRCSDTLEFLAIVYLSPGVFPSAPVIDQ